MTCLPDNYLQVQRNIGGGGGGYLFERFGPGPKPWLSCCRFDLPHCTILVHLSGHISIVRRCTAIICKPPVNYFRAPVSRKNICGRVIVREMENSHKNK